MVAECRSQQNPKAITAMNIPHANPWHSAAAGAELPTHTPRACLGTKGSNCRGNAYAPAMPNKLYPMHVNTL
jgi:hypothetical protein